MILSKHLPTPLGADEARIKWTYKNPGVVTDNNSGDITITLGDTNGTLTLVRFITVNQGVSVGGLSLWSSPRRINGTDGLIGYNTALVNVYQRKTTIPTTLPDDIGTYTFGTATLRFQTAVGQPFDQTVSNGWFVNIADATGTDQLYIRSVTVVSRTDSDTIATNEWSGVVQAGTVGTDGLNGLSNAAAIYYRRNNLDTAPTDKPTSESAFNLGTGSLTPSTNGNWQTLESLSSTGKYLWFTIATASSRTSTDTIATSEWADALLLVEDGTDGSDGSTWLTGTGVPTPGQGNDGDLYLRTVGEIIYKKANGAWTIDIPTLKGTDGTNPNVINWIFQDSATLPATPANDAGIPTGWTDDSPASPTNDIYTVQGVQTAGTGDYVWGTVIKLTGNTGDTGTSITATTVVVSTGTQVTIDSSDATVADVVFNVDDGTNGVSGVQSANGTIYYSVAQASAPSAPTATAYSFSTGAFTSLTTNWSKDATSIVASQTDFYWQVTYEVAEATAGGVQTITFGTVTSVAVFSNLVVTGGAAADINAGCCYC